MWMIEIFGQFLVPFGSKVVFGLRPDFFIQIHSSSIGQVSMTSKLKHFFTSNLEVKLGLE